MLERQPTAGAAETGHHFIEDEHDAELVGQLAHALHIAFRRYQNACGAGNALQQDSGDGARPLTFDDPAQVLQGTRAFFFFVRRIELAAIQVGIEKVHMATGVLIGHAAWVAGGDDGRAGAAVVRAVGGEDLVATGVQARHAHGVLVGIGPGVGEEHLGESGRRAGEDALGGFATHQVGGGRGDGHQAAGLFLDGGDHLRVLVADIGVDQLAAEVEVAFAVVVPQRAALAAGNHQRVEGALGRPGMKDVLAIQIVDVLVADRCAHDDLGLAVADACTIGTKRLIAVGPDTGSG